WQDLPFSMLFRVRLWPVLFGVLRWCSGEREGKVFHDRRGNGSIDDLVDGQRRLGALDIPSARFGCGMARREQRAAVLIGNDRDGVGSQPLRLRGDLGPVDPDQVT